MALRARDIFRIVTIHDVDFVYLERKMERGGSYRSGIKAMEISCLIKIFKFEDV